MVHSEFVLEWYGSLELASFHQLCHKFDKVPWDRSGALAMGVAGITEWYRWSQVSLGHVPVDVPVSTVCSSPFCCPLCSAELWPSEKGTFWSHLQISLSYPCCQPNALSESTDASVWSQLLFVFVAGFSFSRGVSQSLIFVELVTGIFGNKG